MFSYRVTKLLIVFILAFCVSSSFCCAQFKSDPFSNGFGGSGKVAPADSAEVLFSLKDYFGGLGHNHEIKLGVLAGGSFVFVGGMQIYNKQYWKLPLVYGAIGAGIGGGIYYKDKYKKSLDSTPDTKAQKTGNLLLAAGALAYWGTMMDGVISFKTDMEHHPGKATMYSILLPGLGQAYNGEYWKIPIYWGCLAGSYHFLSTNQANYKRFKTIHNEATDPEGTYTGTISAETALYYRNIYRRYRDYSALALAAFYLLQVIDANVFSYMQEFEVSDDLTMDVRPSLILPEYQFAASGSTNAAFGLSLGFRF